MLAHGFCSSRQTSALLPEASTCFSVLSSTTTASFEYWTSILPVQNGIDLSSIHTFLSFCVQNIFRTNDTESGWRFVSLIQGDIHSNKMLSGLTCRKTDRTTPRRCTSGNSQPVSFQTYSIGKSGSSRNITIALASESLPLIVWMCRIVRSQITMGCNGVAGHVVWDGRLNGGDPLNPSVRPRFTSITTNVFPQCSQGFLRSAIRHSDEQKKPFFRVPRIFFSLPQTWQFMIVVGDAVIAFSL